MSIVCILQRKRTWLCPHCPSPSVLTRENLQAKLKQKVRLCYMTVSSALSQTEWATVEGCVRLHMCAEKDNLVLAANKWLIMLCVVFGKWGSSHKPNPGILLNSVILQTGELGTEGNYNVNKYKMAFIQLIDIYVSSVFARSKRSRVGEKRHPGGDCTQRP